MTTDLILPPGIYVPPTVEPLAKPPEDESDDVKNLALPRPTGWKLLCAVPAMPKTYGDTGIERPESYAAQEQHGTTVLFVLAMGPEAFGDTAKFPSGAWCKVGDFILVRTYSGTRFKVFQNEFRIINDDQVEAVVPDPRGVTRV